MSSSYAAPLPPNLARILRHHSRGTVPTGSRRKNMTITIPISAAPEPSSPSDSPCDCPECCPSPTLSLSSAPSTPTSDTFDDDDNDDDEGDVYFAASPGAKGWSRLLPGASKQGYTALDDDEAPAYTHEYTTGYDTIPDEWTSTLSPVAEVDELPRLERVIALPRTPVAERVWTPVLETGVLEVEAVELEGDERLLASEKEVRGSVWGRFVGRLRRRSREGEIRL